MERSEIHPNKIVVHDISSNVVLAAHILQEKRGWMSVQFTGHTLQFMINCALNPPQISKSLGAGELSRGTLFK